MTHSEWSDIYYEKLRGMKTTVEELKQLKEAFAKSCQKTGKPQLGYQKPKKDTSENREFYI